MVSPSMVPAFSGNISPGRPQASQAQLCDASALCSLPGLVFNPFPAWFLSWLGLENLALQISSPV